MIKKNKKVLITVDVQNDFVEGALGSEQAKAIIPKVKEKIAKYREDGDEIVVTQDTHTKLYLQTQEGKNLPVEHCLEGTWGWQLVDGLIPDGCTVRTIAKPTFGSLQLADMIYQMVQELEAKGYDVDEIELIGLCTDICVISSALILKAKFPETKITVDASCCAGVTEESHKAALLVMKVCQVNVINEEA